MKSRTLTWQRVYDVHIKGPAGRWRQRQQIEGN